MPSNISRSIFRSCLLLALLGETLPASAEQIWESKPWIRKYPCSRGYQGIGSIEINPFWIDSFRGSWNTDAESRSASLELNILAVHNASLMSCQDIDVSSLKNSIDFQVLGHSVGKLENFSSNCPLPITDALTPIEKTRFSSYHLLYSFQSTHEFQTLASTFRFRRVDGQELDCGKAKITPDLDDSISAVLTFVPLAILIIVALSSWRVNQNSLTYAHGPNASSFWSIVLEITSYLRYLQFAFITASMTIEYPGFFVPAVSKLSWASLLYWSGPFRSGYMYEGPTGGMYTSNASYGLGFMTQMLRSIHAVQTAEVRSNKPCLSRTSTSDYFNNSKVTNNL
ncbi:hypothetical protein FVER53590_27541 [Fusarium verticillioides]|nr:hypothetical protein FVER53590_27541 [Fusarium verticillioides]